MSDNPYVAPQSDLEKQSAPTPGGGSLQAGIEGRYRLDIGEVLSEAWEKTKGNKLTLLVGVVIVAAGSIATSNVVALFGLDGNAIVEQGDFLRGLVVSSLVSLITLPVVGPLSAGLYLMAIRLADGQQVGLGQMFDHFHRVVDIVIVSLLSTVLMYIGFALFLIPGIYLAVAYVLALPLMIEKNLKPWQALEASRKAITHSWFSVFGVGVVMAIILVLSAIPLLIGFIWTVPMLILTYAVMYRIIFGVEGSTPGDDKTAATS